MCFSEKKRGKVWKDYIEQIMNEENDWDHNVKGDTVESPVVCIGREDVLQALNEMKTRRSPGSSEVSLELIAVSGEVGIQVMAEICQRVHGFVMPAERALSIVVPIFNGKGDIRNYSWYGAVKLLEHGLPVVERVLEARLHKIVSIDEIQFGFLPER